MSSGSSGSYNFSGIVLLGASMFILHSVASFKNKKPHLVSSIVRRMTMSTSAPKAKKVPGKILFGKHPTEFRGNSAMDPAVYRDDDYNWLRDETRSKKEVLDHLIAENDFVEHSTQHLKPLQETLYKEMLTHLKETDEDVPYRYGPYHYYSRTQEGLSYAIHCRKDSMSDGATETVVIDENKLAEGHEYTDVQTIAVSPSHSLVAYACDYSGYETYDVCIKTVSNSAEDASKPLIDEISNTSGDICWANDDSCIFYSVMDEEHRPYKLFLHVLGTPQSEDICIHTEEDQLFWMHVGQTADKKYLIFGVDSKETSECFVLDLQGLQGGAAHIEAVQQAATNGRTRCLQKRLQGLRYEVDHREGQFYITHNGDGAKNNKLSVVAVEEYFSTTGATADRTKWVDVRPYHPDEQIDDVLPFLHWTAIFGREKGVQRLWLMLPGVAEWHAVDFTSQDTYSLRSGVNMEFDSETLRIGFSSFLTPKQVIDLCMTVSTGADGKQVVQTTSTIMKEQEVPGYDSSLYRSERIEGLSSDGKTKIPMSLVYRAEDGVKDGGVSGLTNRPVLLYGYGSYGSCMDPSFDYKRSVLLDRGVVYVVAHIRGGGEMGRGWYEDEGKYLTKQNTFLDFTDCAAHLIDTGLTSADRLAIVGRSAGGLLIGAAVNMRPELFKCAIADVPFVDVLNTMCDPTIPLTVGEWEEWGNPNEKSYFDYMQSYSPYDNVKKQAYPAMLVNGGLNDPRVPYWEPAKWVAKLRAMKTDSNALLFKTDMSSGHFSASDRYKYIKETAVEYSFILDQLKATKGL
jgi:oligopeptidase B